ncbi:MAG: hypothetical protein SGPRY_005004 [Prymnesium sp.]
MACSSAPLSRELLMHKEKEAMVDDAHLAHIVEWAPRDQMDAMAGLARPPQFCLTSSDVLLPQISRSILHHLHLRMRAALPAASTTSWLLMNESEPASKKRPKQGPRGRSKAARKTKESAVPVAERLTRFPDDPDEGFKLSAGKLFCQPCKEALVNLKEGLKRHVIIIET